MSHGEIQLYWSSGVGPYTRPYMRRHKAIEGRYIAESFFIQIVE